jgi:hypothetical protein
MKILAIPVPFQAFVNRIITVTFVELFADPQTPFRGMQSTLFLIQTADPSGSGVVFTMTPENIVNLIDQAEGEVPVLIIPCLTKELKEVADGKSIGPQVTPRNLRGR